VNPSDATTAAALAILATNAEWVEVIAERNAHIENLHKLLQQCRPIVAASPGAEALLARLDAELDR
jgi:hypothetical protein